MVDDYSTDSTPQILRRYKQHIHVVRTPHHAGNKSYAQEYGLQFIKGDVFIATDADTILSDDFIERIERDFENPAIAAVGGYVQSMQHNWITRHRAFEYSIGQNFHKIAQSHMNFLFVIPGAAGAFRTSVFREFLSFDHDTITEDLDFTYKLHKKGFKVLYDRKAIVHTQDPWTLGSYINQMRRWFGGGWQNLLKHHGIAMRPTQALELSLMYIEGVVFSLLMLVLPFINLYAALLLSCVSFLAAAAYSVYASIKEKRADLLLAPFPYVLFLYINAYIFLEQFLKEAILHKKQMLWVTPRRR